MGLTKIPCCVRTMPMVKLRRKHKVVLVDPLTGARWTHALRFRRDSARAMVTQINSRRTSPSTIYAVIEEER